MSILEKLRPQPRWKHADPAIRASAVYDLGPDELDALFGLACEDAEPRVRRAAVTRIDDIGVLAEIASSDPDEDVRQEAVRGLAGIAAEGDDLAQAVDAARRLRALGRVRELVLVARDSSRSDVRAAIVDLLDDQKSLGSISRHAQDGVTRLRALARVTDPAELLTVALKSEYTDTAIAALERITELELLTEISQRARNKVAVRRARARLRLMAEAAQPEAVDADVQMNAEDHQRALALLHRVEALVATTDPEEATSALASVRMAWAELQADVDVESGLIQQFEIASDAVREAIDERRQERAAEEERIRALAREQADRVAICEEIAGLSGPTAADRVAELKVRWDSRPPMPSEYGASLTRRFQDACRTFENQERRRLLAESAAARLETLATELEQLAASDQATEEIVARWRGLRRDADVLREHASANAAAAERLERVVARLEEREQQHVEARAKQEQDNLRRLQQLCRHVETLAATEQMTLRAGRRALREIRAALENRVPLPTKKDWQHIHSRLDAARLALTPRVQELREADEWQRWANLQVQETLCREMEQLKDESDPEVAIRRMRDIQRRWRDVALAPRAQGEAAWRRLKAAQNEVFARTASYRARQAEERAQNLARKEALSERAEALADSTDWVRTAIAVQALQAEWKGIGPVNHGREKALWDRFRAACHRFFTRRQQDLRQRKEVWAANLARKEALCAEAEALAESTEWEIAAARIRQLQVDWKTIGQVRKSKSDAVWQRFRTACDRFFDRYKHRDALDRAAKAAPREAVIRELEGLVPSPGAEPAPAPDGLYERVKQARQRWHEAPELPRHAQDDLALRYHEALGRLIGAWPDAFSGTDLDPEATRKRMEKLVAKVEQYADASGSDTSRLSPAEKLAQQWRERLAANTIAGARSAETDEDARRRTAEQEVRNAQAQWMRLGPTPAEIAGPLNARFQRACRRFYESHKSHVTSHNKSQILNSESQRSL